MKSLFDTAFLLSDSALKRKGTYGEQQCLKVNTRYLNDTYFLVKGFSFFWGTLPMIALLLMVTSARGQIECGFDALITEGESARMDAMIHESSFLPEAGKFTLPIVFHIIKNGTQGDALDNDVLQLLDFLNEAFANRGFYDPQLGVDTEIGFCLAKQDPSGLPTSGITRTESALTVLIAEEKDKEMKGLIHWDPQCYINVYLVDEIISAALGGGVQGYSNFPTRHGSATDGIVIESRLGNGSPVNAVVLVHEMGHFLGLYHTFEGGCANDDCMTQGDRVCDTPPDNSTAPSPCLDPINSCQTDANSGFSTDVPDMVINYMDYGYLDCRKAFTQGQKDRMQAAIIGARMSQLHCESCTDPCDMPFSVKIDYDSLTASLGQPYYLRTSGVPVGANSEWWVNGVSQGVQDNLTLNFTAEGKYIIILQVTGVDPRCRDTDTICVEVYCPLILTHNVRDTACLEQGSVLDFTASVTRTSEDVEWYLDGILAMTGGSFSWTVPAGGVHTLQLRVNDPVCTIQSTVYKFYVLCQEECDNGFDDDGDGLIDGFDPDCCDTINKFYFDPCYDHCPYEIKDAFTSIQLKYQTSGFLWHDGSSPMVGDVDGDGEVELVGLKSEFINVTQKVCKNYLIVNGKDGTLETDFAPFGTWRNFSQQLALADTDRDGLAEIYSYSRNFTRYDIQADGTITLKWSQSGGAFRQPSIVDIDGDGLSEVVVYNGIFDANTGAALVPINTTINVGGVDWVASKSGSAVVDVLPDDFCAQCDGMELVVGGQVYSVDLNRGGISRINLEVELPNGNDGYTSIADMDLDGDLDAVVVFTTPLPDFMTERHISVWDIQTPTTLTPDYTWISRFDRVSQAALGDVNGDGRPEVVVADISTVRVLSPAGVGWTELFVVSNDDGSGMAGCSLFDFDADGSMEVLIRDQKNIRILDGASGSVLFSDDCESGTGHETPIVADIDGDREAELICSCSGTIKVYEPNPGTWALTRPVWNQGIYYAVNVNDDLTIPRIQQRHQLPGDFRELNFYMAQYGTKEYEAADLTGRLIEKRCDGQRLYYRIEICNLGPATFSDTLKIRGYEEDPRMAQGNISYRWDTLLPIMYVDSCMTIELSLPPVVTKLYLVLNDDGSISTPFDPGSDFPSTDVAECDYGNNVVELSGFPLVSGPNLGPDTVMCETGTFLLDAGGGYASYVWQDGSEDRRYTVYGPGKYWVVVMDSCGREYVDTLLIGVDSAASIDLGDQVTLCGNDVLDLTIGDFQNIRWTPAGSVDCSTCPTVRWVGDSSILLEVWGETEGGCIAYDSLRIEVLPGHEERDTAYVCPGDSVFIENAWYSSGDLRSDTVHLSGTCDSIQSTWILELQGEVLSLPDTIEVKEGEVAQVLVGGDIGQVEELEWYADSSRLELSCYDCEQVEVLARGDGTIFLIYRGKDGCEYIISTFIKVIRDEGRVFVPNVFSPNGDQVNDGLKIYANVGTATVELFEVYDRWGELLYRLEEQNVDVETWKGWDGTMNGREVMPGVYVVRAVVYLENDERLMLSQGVTLIR